MLTPSWAAFGLGVVSSTLAVHQGKGAEMDASRQDAASEGDGADQSWIMPDCCPPPATHRTIYHRRVRFQTREEHSLTAWPCALRARLEGALAQLQNQERRRDRIQRELEVQLADVQKAVWKLEVLYQAVQCKFPDMVPSSSHPPTRCPNDILDRIPAVLKALSPAPDNSPTASFNPRLMQDFVHLTAEEPQTLRLEATAVVAYPALNPTKPKHLMLSKHFLHIYPSKEDYHLQRGREAVLDLRGSIVNSTVDFVVAVRGPTLPQAPSGFRIEFECGDEWRQWVVALQRVGGAAIAEVWQFERWLPVLGWRPSPFPGDPHAFSDSDGVEARPLDQVSAQVEQSGYWWCGGWALALGEDFGEGGWQYSPTPRGWFQPRCPPHCLMRRRLWRRACTPGLPPDPVSL